MKTAANILLAFSLSILGSVTFAAPPAPATPKKEIPKETPDQHDARMAWFREARFGMFIHWGVYAVPAGEWGGKRDYGEWIMEQAHIPVSQYEQLAAQFNPMRFSARDWVRMAKDAGMKYIVITSKHHDGFCLFDSKLTNWDIMATPFKRDPLRELAAACKAADIKLCFYHSIMDWHHPDYEKRRAWNDRATGKPDMDRYVAYMKGQLKEVLTNYGPIGILWFDGEWEEPWTHDRGVDLYTFVRSLQPNIIVNNRVGKGRAGMAGMDKGELRVGDYGTPEQEIPPTGFGPGVDWESCMTMNNHWGYNKSDQNWKSTQTLIRNLIDCASKGGNYLLNIGPTAEGLFPTASIQRLAEIGRWMKVNGDSIYGTTASPFNELPFNGRCTRKAPNPVKGEPGKLYLHVYEPPKDLILKLPGFKNRLTKAYLLADPRKQPLAVGQAGGEGQIRFPSVLPVPFDQNAMVVVAEYGGTLDVELTLPTQSRDGVMILRAADAVIRGNKAAYVPGVERECITYWTDPRDTVSWQFKLSIVGKYNVSARYSCAADSAGCAFTVFVGDEKVVNRVGNTGSWGRYLDVPIGQVTLREPGPITVTVRADTKPGQPAMNLRNVTLTPAP